MSYHPKVLVVDDDTNILAAFEDFLKKEHCCMLSATSAEEALKKLQTQPVDLLVTDVRLEARSGPTLLLHVKESLPKIPIIVITGYPDLVSSEDARIYGADYFFLKPLEIEKLRSAVRTCLHLNNNSPIHHS